MLLKSLISPLNDVFLRSTVSRVLHFTALPRGRNALRLMAATLLLEPLTALAILHLTLWAVARARLTVPWLLILCETSLIAGGVAAVLSLERSAVILMLHKTSLDAVGMAAILLCEHRWVFPMQRDGVVAICVGGSAEPCPI